MWEQFHNPWDPTCHLVVMSRNAIFFSIFQKRFLSKTGKEGWVQLRGDWIPPLHPLHTNSGKRKNWQNMSCVMWVPLYCHINESQNIPVFNIFYCLKFSVTFRLTLLLRESLSSWYQTWLAPRFTEQILWLHSSLSQQKANWKPPMLHLLLKCYKPQFISCISVYIYSCGFIKTHTDSQTYKGTLKNS